VPGGGGKPGVAKGHLELQGKVKRWLSSRGAKRSSMSRSLKKEENNRPRNTKKRNRRIAEGRQELSFGGGVGTGVFGSHYCRKRIVRDGRITKEFKTLGFAELKLVNNLDQILYYGLSSRHSWVSGGVSGEGNRRKALAPFSSFASAG